MSCLLSNDTSMDAPAPNLMAFEMILDTICSSARRSQRPRNVAGARTVRGERLKAASGEYDSTMSRTTSTKSTDSTCGCTRLAFIRPTSQQQGGAFHISVNDVLNTLEAPGQRCCALLVCQLQGRRDLQQEGMHGIAQLVRRDGE